MSLISQMASEKTTDMDASLRWHDGESWMRSSDRNSSNHLFRLRFRNPGTAGSF